MSAPVTTFMENKAPQLDPSWQISATNKFVENQRKSSQQAHERTKSFKSLVAVFIKHTKQKDLRSFDVNRVFCWEDVKTMASDAMERDENKAKWHRNPFRTAGRSLQRNASNFELLVEFLPNNEFTAILCGALTLVFCAARCLEEARSKIFRCLESLPGIIRNTEEYVDIYDDDPKIWAAAEDLYLGILDGVEGMLQWIDKSAFEHAWKSLVFSATYNQDLEENFIKKGIEDRVAQFREVVLVSLHRQARQEANSIRALVTQLNYLVDYAQWKADNPHAVVLFRTSFINLDQLRSIINVDPVTTQQSIEVAILDAQNACPLSLINHTMHILRNPKFGMWLQSNMSHILLINGRMQLTPEQEAASPLTIVACLLSTNIVGKSSQCLSLTYLCGQHSPPDNPLQGPGGMLRCLSSQLAETITREKADLSTIDLTFVEGIKAHDVATLYKLFKLLLFSTTQQVIFVIIDGISIMEEGPLAQDFGNVVVSLCDLVNELNRLNTGRIIKVLLTNPSASIYGHHWLPEECTLEMDDVEEWMDPPINAEDL